MNVNFIKKTSIFACVLISCCLGGVAFSSKSATVKPRIIILATGGTIAGEAKSSVAQTYDPAKIPVQSMIGAVPALSTIANVSGEQTAQVGSNDITIEGWLKIAKRANQLLESRRIDGIVITHGTDTLEETAYFLNLVIKSKKPVVIVGSMRPSNGISADGPLNLFNAVAVAASPFSREKGVLVVLNDTIHGARDATKTNTTNVDTFKSPNGGSLGYVHNGRVTFRYASLRKNTWQTEFSVDELVTLPKVDIVYTYINADPSLIKAMIEAGDQGIVVAGSGNGGMSDTMFAALKEAVHKGLVVVRSSRTGSGQVDLGEEASDKAGILVSDDINPQKARILLALALSKTHEPKKIQSMFFKY